LQRICVGIGCAHIARLLATYLVVLDLRPADAYWAGHVPGAVSADYRTTEWGVPGPNGAVRALPPVDRIAATIGALGVGDADTVVLVADDFASAARVYWTFKVLGHT
jgi:thiosulfate/3-mercaptopyruvate sulfurtransferase